MSEMVQRSGKRILLNTLKTVLTLAVLYFVYDQFAEQSSQISEYQ